MKYLKRYKSIKDIINKSVPNIPNITYIDDINTAMVSKKVNYINIQKAELNGELVTVWEWDGNDVTSIWSGMYNISQKKQIPYSEAKNLADGFYRCVGWWDLDYDGWFNYLPNLNNNGLKYFEMCVLNDPRYYGAPPVEIEGYKFNAGWCLYFGGGKFHIPLTFNDPKRYGEHYDNYPYSQPILLNEDWNFINPESGLSLKDEVNNYFKETYGREFNLDDITFPEEDIINDENAFITHMDFENVLFTGFAPPDNDSILVKKEGF